MIKSFMTPSFGLLLIVFASSAAVAEPDASAGSWSTTTGSTNGVSTGVGNAGSFGIGSGTADSLSNGTANATATATSDGVHQANTYDILDNSVSMTTMSVQDLQASTVGNQITYNAGSDPQDSPLPTGTNSAAGSSFSNFAGILANGWNVGPASNVMTINNLSVNGGLAQR